MTLHFPQTNGRSGGDPPITRAGDVLSIFKKEDGKWRLARDANMLTKCES